MIIHLTVRTLPPFRPFDDEEGASWVWSGLRRHFPQVAGAVLMPNHLHVLPIVEDPDRARFQISRLLAGHAKLLDLRAGRYSWRVVRPWTEVPDLHHLARQIRYLALNPCRAGSVRDPLEWRWSTHRDVMGASADPWVSGRQIASLFRRHWTPAWAERWHSYVSADPSVSVTGTPPPSAPSAGVASTSGLDDATALGGAALPTIAHAALEATRLRPGALRRKTLARTLFLHLAREQGWRDARLLASRCSVHPNSVRRAWSRPPAAQAMHAVRLCLADRRLRPRP